MRWNRKPYRAHAQTRFATLEDVPALVALEQEVWGAAAASEWQLVQRVTNVPRGNILALSADERICGLVSFCMLEYAEHESWGACSWDDLSGGGTASTDVPGARDLFGINLGVTSRAPKDTSVRLVDEAIREGIRVRVRRIILGARVPRFHRYAHRMTAEEYWKAEHRPGVPFDPELRFYHRFGMQPVKLVENYFEDPESLNWGVMVELRLPRVVRAAGPALAALPISMLAVLEKFR